MNNTISKPLVHSGESNRWIHVDFLVALCFPLILSIVYYGMRPIVISLVAMIAAAVTEAIALILMKRPPAVLNCSAIATGLAIALLLPPAAPLWLPLIGGIFAVLVISVPLGGLERTPFSPVAGAVAFMIVCWPTRIFAYPDMKVVTNIPIFGSDEIVPSLSSAGTLKLGGIPTAQFDEMLLGYTQGPIGASMILIIIACFLYLVLRKAIAPSVTFSFIATAGLFAIAFPRVNAPVLMSGAYELLSGSMIFVAVFLLSDRRTAPQYLPARILYGCLAGFFTMILQYFGPYEQAAVFVVLFMNAISPALNRYVWKLFEERGLKDEAS